MMDLNEVFLKKILECYTENENVFIANRERGKKYPLTFINLFEENRDISIFQKYRTTYILFSALIDGTEPDEYNRMGREITTFYAEEIIKKKRRIISSLMSEKKEEVIQALINEYNQIKRNKVSFYKNEQSEKKTREIILSLKNEFEK